ncbi:hypothetical protein N7326_02340 [Corynebacterium sp. ES2794-CONJ1]|uniref:hypothetical protein n=1 Tax=unclassified Corynebacterium TaxID=2624378 RepID=UPI002169AC1C|nr:MULTISPECIES: hypothetical protein [unclassified Corynebacterium]MCS4490768.1 hypothetical protein [Corynebacterium sp. ES2775-CONJ]MCS4492406.1 hypothetical protein [Corynebacterium sp. ES2715-CONJ3]MCS4532679.1 hypothetical protein [Corynebacterium sp. ES2730-CONJ]MCU9518713.1 hypothetical protein [Corynebacterium sp. ES2794-CONJ1]
MALTFTLDLNQCTLEQLRAFMRAVEASGMKPSAELVLEDQQLVARINNPHTSHPQAEPTQVFDPVSLGDTAVNALIDALKNRRG